jgi:hypothetical protein
LLLVADRIAGGRFKIAMTDNKTEENISSPEAPCAEKQPANFVSDPDALAKMLDMELVLKREKWKRQRSQRGTWRALSIFFLVLVIGGALAAYFFFAMSYRQPAEPAPSVETKDSVR